MADEGLPPEPPPTIDAHPAPDDPRIDHVLHAEVNAALTAQAIADRENAGPLDHLSQAWVSEQKLRMRQVRQQVIADYQARRMMAPPFRRGEG